MKDQRNANRRERYKNDPEYRKLCSERSRAWREKNKKANLEHHREYYEKNKDCISQKNKKYYEENKEYISMRNKKYNKSHREQINATHSIWKKNNRDKMNAYQQCLRERKWPLYSKAHRLVEKLVKDRWIKRDRCPICNSEWIVVAHHPDYNKPYEVVPCCNMCHSAIHNWFIECPQPINLLLTSMKDTNEYTR